MCYYALLVYDACAHTAMGAVPLHPSPPCPWINHGADAVPRFARSEDAPLSDRPWQAHAFNTENICPFQLCHPFRTWQLSGLCGKCRPPRDERLAKLRTAVADSTISIIARYTGAENEVGGSSDRILDGRAT